MTFSEMYSIMKPHVDSMLNDNDHLFVSNVNGYKLYDLYLDSFPVGMNEIFRVRREFDCSCCAQFIRILGNVVSIKNNKITTIWDVPLNDDKFSVVFKTLSDYIKSRPIENIFMHDTSIVGAEMTYEQNKETNDVITWYHYYAKLPNKYIVDDPYSRSIASIIGPIRDNRMLFKRALDKLTEDSILTTLELINQNSLYKGPEWKRILEEFLKYKREYVSLPDDEKDNYTWEQIVKVNEVLAKIRNHSIGTLLINISEDMELDEAVKKYELMVAPTNYKRPKAIYTQKMLDEAKQTIIDLGYLESLDRRYATIDDITVNNTLFSNRDTIKRINKSDIFDDMVPSIIPKKFNQASELNIDQFVDSVLATTTELEVLFENKHEPNLVSLIAPVNKNSKNMFKWNNNFSWAYNGNITDSSIKTNVKNAGGNVTGVLRFSIQWNDQGNLNGNDFDAHCIEPSGFRIYFGQKVDISTKGNLDIDIIRPVAGVPAVENITWPDINRMVPGKYLMQVHNYTHRGGRNGFSAEIEFNGEIHSFEYRKDILQNQFIDIAEVTLSNDRSFSIKSLIPSTVSSKEMWNLKTNNFIPVSIVMRSPNYWDEQQGIGNQHYFFMLKNCINSTNPNGFFNEYLKEELLKHKRVFEALGGRKAVEDSNDQLSGLGFTSSRRNDVVVKVKGQTERIIKVKF